MSRYNHRPDEHDPERSYELERRLDRDEEQEPYWMHYRPLSTKRRPRYFSGVVFCPVATQPPRDVASTGLAS